MAALVRSRAPFHAVLLAVLAATAQALGGASDAYVVDEDGGPGVDFTDLGTAIATVPAGSTLIVREGVYDGLAIDGKSLDLVADAGPGEEVHLADNQLIFVKNLGPDDRVVFRGFHFEGLVALQLSSNQGEVWFEDCILRGSFNGGGLRVEDCASVTLRGCEVYGGFSYFGDPQTALVVLESSAVQVFDSSVTSSAGGDYFCSSSPGAYVHGGSTLFAEDSTFVGGGCGGVPFFDASPAIRVLAGSTALLRNDVLQPGVGTGTTPPPVEVSADSTAVEVADVTRSIDVPGPIRSGDTVTVTLKGAPLDKAVVLYSRDPDGAFFDPYFSVLSLAPPIVVAHTLDLDAAGDGSFPLTPNLPPGIDALTVFVQAGFLNGGAAATGSPSAVTVLAASL